MRRIRVLSMCCVKIFCTIVNLQSLFSATVRAALPSFRPSNEAVDGQVEQKTRNERLLGWISDIELRDQDLDIYLRVWVVAECEWRVEKVKWLPYLSLVSSPASSFASLFCATREAGDVQGWRLWLVTSLGAWGINSVSTLPWIWPLYFFAFF